MLSSPQSANARRPQAIGSFDHGTRLVLMDTQPTLLGYREGPQYRHHSSVRMIETTMQPTTVCRSRLEIISRYPRPDYRTPASNPPSPATLSGGRLAKSGQGPIIRASVTGLATSESPRSDNRTAAVQCAGRRSPLACTFTHIDLVPNQGPKKRSPGCPLDYARAGPETD